MNSIVKILSELIAEIIIGAMKVTAIIVVVELILRFINYICSKVNQIFVKEELSKKHKVA